MDAMNWKRMLAYVTGNVDEELLARDEYLSTENRILSLLLVTLLASAWLASIPFKPRGLESLSIVRFPNILPLRVNGSENASKFRFRT
jgi:hypothetical protein